MSEPNKVRYRTKSLLMAPAELAELAGVSLPTARNLPVKKVQVGARYKFLRVEAEKFLSGDSTKGGA